MEQTDRHRWIKGSSGRPSHLSARPIRGGFFRLSSAVLTGGMSGHRPAQMSQDIVGRHRHRFDVRGRERERRIGPESISPGAERAVHRGDQDRQRDLMAERVGFEPTCRYYPTIRFRVGAVMTASVPLPGRAGILAHDERRETTTCALMRRRAQRMPLLAAAAGRWRRCCWPAARTAAVRARAASVRAASCAWSR